LKPTRRRPQRKLLLKPWLKRLNAPEERLRSRGSVKRRRPKLPAKKGGKKPAAKGKEVVEEAEPEPETEE